MLGALIARVMTTLLVALLPALPLPIDASLPLDGRVIAFTVLLSLPARSCAVSRRRFRHRKLT